MHGLPATTRAPARPAPPRVSAWMLAATLSLTAASAAQDGAVRVLQWQGDAPPPGSLEMAAWCRAVLEPYMAPRHWWVWVGDWPQTASGKTDHAAIARALQAPSPPLERWR